MKGANALKPIEDHEETQATWVHIHQMDGTSRVGGGLSKIIAPDEYGEWRELVFKEWDQDGNID